MNHAPALLIRADGGTRMGTGHVMRCLALGQRWKGAGAPVVFAGHVQQEALVQRILDEDFTFVPVPSPHPDPADATLVQRLAQEHGARWVVTDGYHFDLSYQKGLRKEGLRLIVIDDFQHADRYEADLLVNQNILEPRRDYCCNTDCTELLGPRYALIREEFTRMATGHHSAASSSNLLITMGGSDPDNASLRIAKRLVATPSFDTTELHIVVGPSNPHAKTLEELANRYGRIHILRNVTDMPALLATMDYAISAAGSTCWELMYYDIPFCTVILAQNQEPVSKGLERALGIKSLGWSDNALDARLDSFLTHPAHVQRGRGDHPGIVDGLGPERILSRPAQECALDLFNDRCMLREVRAEDSPLLFAWANDPVTRENSFQKNPIPLANHETWFADKLHSPNSFLYLLLLDEHPTGHIRFEIQHDLAILSFVVAPSFRGLGLGRRLVSMGSAEFQQKRPELTIEAQTLPTNRASQRIFETLGFLNIGTGVQSNVYHLPPPSP